MLRVVQWATGGVGKAAIDADVVVYAPLIPDAGEVARVLRSGKNVVTPVGWFYPSERDAELERACVDVCAAAPGIKSSLDLSVVAGRAHPDLGAARG